MRRGKLHFAPFIEMPTVDNVSEREFPAERLPELFERLREHDEPLADLVALLARGLCLGSSPGPSTALGISCEPPLKHRRHREGREDEAQRGYSRARRRSKDIGC